MAYATEACAACGAQKEFTEQEIEHDRTRGACPVPGCGNGTWRAV